MKIGYTRTSKARQSQSIDAQCEALIATALAVAAVSCTL
mgnify:FL=1